MLLDLIVAEDDADVRDVGIPAIAGARLDKVVREVVALAQRDTLRSAAPPGFASRWASRLFGIEPTPPLANPELEALRVYCVLSRHRHARSEGAWEVLRAIGYTGAQRRAVGALVAS